MRTSMLYLVGEASLLAMCVLASCSPGTDKPAAPPVPQAKASGSLGKHWVADQRLRTVMDQLSKRLPSWPKGMPEDPEQPAKASLDRDFAEVADLAGSLATTSQHIPELATKLTMGEADRRGFMAEAATLHDQAAMLQEAAVQHKIEQMQRLMEGINSTCISCHSRYRDFSGQLNSPRASLDFRTAITSANGPS